MTPTEEDQLNVFVTLKFCVICLLGGFHNGIFSAATRPTNTFHANKAERLQ